MSSSQSRITVARGISTAISPKLVNLLSQTVNVMIRSAGKLPRLSNIHSFVLGLAHLAEYQRPRVTSECRQKAVHGDRNPTEQNQRKSQKCQEAFPTVRDGGSRRPPGRARSWEDMS